MTGLGTRKGDVSSLSRARHFIVSVPPSPLVIELTLPASRSPLTIIYLQSVILLRALSAYTTYYK